MYVKRVFLVFPDGSILTKEIVGNTTRHDILVGQIIKEIDPNYEIKDSLLDNSRIACEEYDALVIMPDINDEVILCPQEPTSEQSLFFLENFLESSANLRVHMMIYVKEKKRYKDVRNIKLFFEKYIQLGEANGKSR